MAQDSARGAAPAAPKTPALGTSLSPLTPPSKRQERRAFRSGLRIVSSGVAENRRLRYCGYALGNVPVRVDTNCIAHVGGIATCASIWVCPVCGPKIRNRRAELLQDGFDRLFAMGGGGAFVTLTLPHGPRDALAPRLDLLARATGKLVCGRPWDKVANAIGFLGNIRTVEITYGEANGFHPHLHIAMCTAHTLTPVELARVTELVERRWTRYVQQAGFGVINGHGVDVRPMTSAAVGQYLSKGDEEGGWGVGRELARVDLKTRSVFTILERLRETGESRFAAAWLELTDATYGRKCIVTSRGLRELFGAQDQSDDALLGTEVVGPATVAWFHRKQWNGLRYYGQEAAMQTTLEHVRAVFQLVGRVGGHLDKVNGEEV